MDNVEMKATIDRLNSDNRQFNGTMKHALAERHFLDDRLTEVQSRHTLDLNRLHSTVADKERVKYEKSKLNGVAIIGQRKRNRRFEG